MSISVKITIMVQGYRRIASAARRMALRAFGARLRTARRSSGHTQEAVAELIDVTAQTVRNWEAGRSEPSEDNKVKLAEVYGVSRESFLELHELPVDDPSLMLLYDAAKVDPSRLLTLGWRRDLHRLPYPRGRASAEIP